MTNAELLAKIKAEIERRITDNTFGAKLELIDILAWLSTLESEKPMNQEGLEEEYKDYVENDPVYSKLVNRNAGLGIARHFAKWGSEHLATSGKTSGGSSEIPNCLNKLADYARRQVEELLPVIKKYNDYSEEQIEELRTHLMAMFLEGAGWQKEQMLKDAVEGKVFMSFAPGHNQMVMADVDLPTNTKVRIIIVKEDEK